MKESIPASASFWDKRENKNQPRDNEWTCRQVRQAASSTRAPTQKPVPSFCGYDSKGGHREVSRTAGKEEEERHLLESPVSSWGTVGAHKLGNGGFSPLLIKAGGRQGRAGCVLALLLEGALRICVGIRRTAPCARCHT